MGENDKSLDIFGVKPAAEAVSHLSKATVDGAGAFLSRICLPAAEELGLLFRDRVSEWRAKNAAVILTEAEQLLGRIPSAKGAHAHPRLVSAIVEKGSWADDGQLRQMWAGLLATACTEDGDDHSNLMFVNFLDQLSPTQARLLKLAVTKTKKGKVGLGWVAPFPDAVVSLEDLMAATGLKDPVRIDLELDHLKTVGLLSDDAGFEVRSTNANVTVHAIAFHFYARCEGHAGPLDQFYTDLVNLDDN